MAKETWFKNVSQPGVSPLELELALRPYQKIVADEALEISYDIKDALASQKVRFTESMGESPSPSALALGSYEFIPPTKIAGSAKVGDFVSLVWKDDRVVVEPRPDFNPNLSLRRGSLEKAVAAVQQSVSANATTLVRATAHANAAVNGGEPDYARALEAPIAGGPSLQELILITPVGDLDF
jgi:hypothetical protein